MRFAIRIVLRAAIVAALAGAIADVKIADSGGPRTRVYVVDASGSVQAGGAPESATVRDALKLVDWDVKRGDPRDRSALILAGAKPVLAVPLTERDSFTA